MRTLLPRTCRRILLASAAVIALAAAGIAIAGPGSPASTSLVSATFYTNALAKNHTETCTPTSGDAYTTFDGWFTGAASSADPRLTGPITVHVQSVLDTTKNVGSLRGDVRIDSTTTPPGHLHAKLTAVNVGGVVQGWLNGNLGDGSHFMGSFSGTFSTATGFSSAGTPATFGSGTATNTAIVWNGRCDVPSAHPGHPNGPKHDEDNHKHHHD